MNGLPGMDFKLKKYRTYVEFALHIRHFCYFEGRTYLGVPYEQK